MLIEVTNPITNTTIRFASKYEYIYYYGKDAYQLNNGVPEIEENLYRLLSRPTGFFDPLTYVPETVKGGNQDGADFTSSASEPRLLTWRFDPKMVVSGDRKTQDIFSSCFNIKNSRLDIKVYHLDNEETISTAKAYRAEDVSFETGTVQVYMDGNGLWEREPLTYLFQPYNNRNAFIPAEKEPVFAADAMKKHFGESGEVIRDLAFNNISATSPIRVEFYNFDTTISNFTVTNMLSGVFETITAEASSSFIFDSENRIAEYDNNNALEGDFVGGFVYLLAGNNTLRFSLTGEPDPQAVLLLEVALYANSISG